MLALAVGVLALSFLLKVRPDARVAFRALPDYPLPETCISRAWFGTPCPGCGLTHGFIHLARADWTSATRAHPLSGVLAFAILLQLPYRGLCLRLGRPPLGTLAPWLFGQFLIASLVLNWVAGVLLVRSG